MYEHGQTIDFELEERNTQAESREQSAEEEHASRLVEGFRPVGNIFLTYCFLIYSALITKQDAEDKFFSGWPLNEDDCLSAGLGTRCDPSCGYCEMKDVCIQCALKLPSMEASVDSLCPLRIPGCRFVNSKCLFFLETLGLSHKTYCRSKRVLVLLSPFGNSGSWPEERC